MIPGASIALARQKAMAQRVTAFVDGGAGFDSWALTEHEPGGEWWRMARPLSYRARSGAIYTIPKGFEFDGASIPRLVWPLLPSRDACFEFAALHDLLFRVGPSLGVHSRRLANDLGWEALVIQDIGDEWQRDAIWEGLKLGSGPVWQRWRALGLAYDDPVMLITRRA